jgi:hypothetical protein
MVMPGFGFVGERVKVVKFFLTAKGRELREWRLGLWKRGTTDERG